MQKKKMFSIKLQIQIRNKSDLVLCVNNYENRKERKKNVLS